MNNGRAIRRFLNELEHPAPPKRPRPEKDADLNDGKEPIRCRTCRYPLRGLPDCGRCPECGEPYERRIHRPPPPPPDLYRGWQSRKQKIAQFQLGIAAFSLIIGVLIMLVVFTRPAPSHSRPWPRYEQQQQVHIQKNKKQKPNEHPAYGPEPSSILLLAAGAAVLLGRRPR